MKPDKSGSACEVKKMPNIKGEYIVPVYTWSDDQTAIDKGYAELIRCKDCKYNSNTEGNFVNCDIIPQMFGKTPDDNYCSWAERRGEE